MFKIYLIFLNYVLISLNYVLISLNYVLISLNYVLISLNYVLISLNYVLISLNYVKLNPHISIFKHSKLPLGVNGGLLYVGQFVVYPFNKSLDMYKPKSPLLYLFFFFLN